MGIASESIRISRLTAPLIVAAVVLSGCAGSRTITSVENPVLEARLRAEVRTWDGTPHVWGGASRAGADCSGFVMRVFEDALEFNLPRTTEEQALVGDRVSENALSPGDLVFFRTAPKTRHVGIYLSNGEFAHASSSEGVQISALDSDYWKRTYWMSRRVLPDATSVLASSQPVPVPATPEATVPPPYAEPESGAASGVRVGW